MRLKSLVKQEQIDLRPVQIVELDNAVFLIIARRPRHRLSRNHAQRNPIPLNIPKLHAAHDIAQRDDFAAGEMRVEFFGGYDASSEAKRGMSVRVVVFVVDWRWQSRRSDDSAREFLLFERLRFFGPCVWLTRGVWRRRSRRKLLLHSWPRSSLGLSSFGRHVHFRRQERLQLLQSLPLLLVFARVQRLRNPLLFSRGHGNNDLFLRHFLIVPPRSLDDRLIVFRHISKVLEFRRHVPFLFRFARPLCLHPVQTSGQIFQVLARVCDLALQQFQLVLEHFIFNLGFGDFGSQAGFWNASKIRLRGRWSRSRKSSPAGSATIDP